MVGRPSVSRIATKAEGKQLAKMLARSLGLKAYGVVDKTTSAADAPDAQRTAAGAAHPDADHDVQEEPGAPWLVPGVGKSL